MKNVLLFGEPMALLIAQTPGPLENVTQFTRSMSGAEVNVAIGLSRLGHTATYLTCLGDDPFGHYIKNALTQEGIDTHLVTFSTEYQTGIQLKSRVEDGSDPIAPYYRRGSAAAHISPEAMDAIDLSKVDLVHITGIPPALSKNSCQATFRLMQRAREAHTYITFDPNLRPALWPDETTMVSVLNELSALADLVLPGIAECQILTKTNTFRDAALFYQNLGIPTVIIKNGAQGAYVKDRNTEVMVPGFKVNQVIDTVGAGDGFAVGVIDGLLHGLKIADATRQGNAIGAIQVMHRGDNIGLPSSEQLLTFMSAPCN